MTAEDREPPPLADSARRLVDAARPLERLPAERKHRVRKSVLAAVAAATAAAVVTAEATTAAAATTTAAETATVAGTGATAAAGTGAATSGASGLGAAAAKLAGLSLFTKIGLSVTLVMAGAVGLLWNHANRDTTPPTAAASSVAATGPGAASPHLNTNSEQSGSTPSTDLPDSPPTDAPPGSATAAAPPTDRTGAASHAASAPAPGAAPEPTGTASGANEPAPAGDPADSLQEETKLLATAHAALARGDAAAALAALDQHAARFPRGALAPERRAARAMALCKQGRSDEGQREAEILYGEGSKSPLAEKIRRACTK